MFKLPPLNPLRAFEVAGRRGSIKLAAEELNVTPGAVSRHVQYLEDYFGLQLFERRNREVELTAVGRTYLAALTDAFGRIDDATRQMTERNRRTRLHIWSSVTFTMRWLVPRLPSFHLDNPGLDVTFTTSLAPLDFTADKVDVAIRAHPIEGDRLTSVLLFETDLLPVCSPDFLAACGPIGGPGDIVRHTRIHSAIRSDDWAKWLRFAGVDGVDAAAGITFESSSLGYRAAQDGLGIALAQKALIADDLARRRLVVALDLPLKGEARYYLTFRRDRKQTKHQAQFQAWIMDQAASPDPPA